MTPAVLGHLALILAWSVSLVLCAMPLWAAHRGRAAAMALAAPVALTQALLVATAFGALLWALGSKDFSIAYVAAHANSSLPLPYRLAAAWGGHEGSLLLWIFILQLWTVALVFASRGWPLPIASRALGVLGMVCFGFLSFTLFTSDPFQSLPMPAVDGADLNPLLQDVGMIFHPPMLYMGYVGFAVSFALAIAALLGQQGQGGDDLGKAWARLARPWTLTAWAFLTTGILLGSFWAYYELGWGGWWFWDAVENASFMPWLAGTALIHSLTVTAQRGTLRGWSVLLAILAFSLSLLGTFLVRSGVITSVHAFAADPARGRFILALLLFFVGGALGLYAWRAPKWQQGQQGQQGAGFSWFSREAALLLNNLFLLVAAGSVLLGTLYPLALEALELDRISVGAPYFESVFVPLMLPMLALLGLGPLLAWKAANTARVKRQCLRAGVFVAALTASLALATQASPMMVLGLLAGLWVLTSTAQVLVRQLAGHAHAVSSDRLRGLRAWLAASRSVPRAFWGMVLAHAGIGIFVVAVTLLRGLEHTQDQSLNIGEVATVGAYQFKLTRIVPVQGPNYRAAQAQVEVSQHGRNQAVLLPQRRLYTVSNMPMTEAAIDRGLSRDLYVSLGEPAPDGRWGMRFQIKPWMSWVWTACLAMAAGGVLAASDRRSARASHRSVQAPASGASDAAPMTALPAAAISSSLHRT